MVTTDRLHFDNPPIYEAIFDIQVEVPESIALETLKTCFNSVKARFPVEKKNIAFQGGIQFGGEGSPSLLQPASEHYGFSFCSSDGKRIAQSRKDGFTFNNLAPYIGWDLFSEEARELWGYYKSIAKPKWVRRIALRYVNRVDLPNEVSDINEYLLTLPKLAENLPQNLSGFFMRVQVNDDATKSRAIIITTIEPSTQGICLIFDIDAFQVVDITNNDSDMWLKFEELRQFKNKLFDESFTPKAKELFR